MMAHHHLHATVETCHWGYFDSTLMPSIKIASGDIVTVDTVSGKPDFLPDPKCFHIPAELAAVHAGCRQGSGSHILTGPIHVEGAQPGDVLEVRIHEVGLRQDWGYNMIRPLMGALPDDFVETRKLMIPLDLARGVAKLPWGLELPLHPFFGVMGVAPPTAWGRISSIVPRAHGGNIDNKELVAGATLFLPVFQEGALFSCGDGHGAQGDGEVCVTAIETALQGTFEFVVRKDLDHRYPRAETPTHVITMGMDPDLDRCMVVALRDMLELICGRTGLSREDAYTLCSLAADLRVTQVVNEARGIHVMLAKALLGDRPTRISLHQSS